jgi:hypothetical protein
MPYSQAGSRKQAGPPIPKPRNTDGAIEDLGILITAAYGLDTNWMEQGSCFNWGSNRPGHPTPWQVAPGKKYNGISGSELQKYALMICNSCDAQYDCADYAVDAKMIAGSWAMPITQLRWLQGRSDAHDLIDMARGSDVPVQEVAAHSMDTCQQSDQSSTMSM